MVEATGAVTAPADSAGPARPPLADRILDGAIDCMARTGVAGTTVDDIARAAGCGRATVYRVFAGGKDALVAAAGEREVERFLGDLGRRLDACPTLEEAVVAGICGPARLLREHDVLAHLVEHEPGVLLPLVSFDGLDPLLARAAAFAGDHLARFLGPAAARAVGEWAARLVVAYAHEPDPAGAVFDLADPAVTRHVVRTFLLPGLDLLAGPGADADAGLPGLTRTGPDAGATDPGPAGPDLSSGPDTPIPTDAGAGPHGAPAAPSPFPSAPDRTPPHGGHDLPTSQE